SLAERIKVYPNPVRSELIADHIEGVTMIEIFDVTGNKCLNEVCDNHNQMTIEVSTLKKGIYFIRFISPGATIMKRFIKE
ncbi:MAG: T9SS type A sorting domain-containing protein, partial [Bacteroidales bacterium]